MTNVFFCWSEQRSHALASVLKKHLPTFIPGLSDDGSNLFMSDDIAKGSRWFDGVEAQLAKADVGIVCITREGLRSGWIHFEAGALGRTIRKKRRQGGALLTYLLGVRPDELTGPLAEYQATSVERDDTRKLCAAIVNVMMRTKAQEPPDWESAFNQNWGNFRNGDKGDWPPAGLRPDSRAGGSLSAQDVQRTMLCHRRAAPVLDRVGDVCLGALLLKETKFDFDDRSGRLVVGDGIKRACESRRGRIRQLVTHLLAPNCAPVLEAESRRCAKMSSFDSRKTLLIHPAEHAIQRRLPGAAVVVGKKELTPDVLDARAASLWEFDRICFYMVQEQNESADPGRLVRDVEHEFESVRAVDGGGSLVPLYYALRALKATVSARALGVTLENKLTPLLKNIVNMITRYGLDPGRQVQDIIADLQSRLGHTDETLVTPAVLRGLPAPA
jgi:hypothetical protein